MGSHEVNPVGSVHSVLKSRDDCPKQGHEGGPEAWIEIYPSFAECTDGITPGAELILLTWFHEAEREVLKVHPRGDPKNPIRGVFMTRSPDRPNPIGLHRVSVLAIDDRGWLKVRPLEAISGTPVIDIKPVLKNSAAAATE